MVWCGVVWYADGWCDLVVVVSCSEVVVVMSCGEVVVVMSCGEMVRRCDVVIETDESQYVLSNLSPLQNKLTPQSLPPYWKEAVGYL